MIPKSKTEATQKGDLALLLLKQQRVRIGNLAPLFLRQVVLPPSYEPPYPPESELPFALPTRSIESFLSSDAETGADRSWKRVTPEQIAKIQELSQKPLGPSPQAKGEEVALKESSEVLADLWQLEQ